MALTEKIAWNDWHPGLDTNELTLAEVKRSLPGANPQEIGFLVRLLENPKSPFALTGAVDLVRHDAIHIVLGRGLLKQDEAFVIGFTMGTAKETLKAWEIALFRFAARFLYSRNYRLARRHLQVFELGLEAGRSFATTRIYEFPFENNLDVTLKELRRTLQIDVEKLKTFYRREIAIIPNSKASRRLNLS